MVKKKYTRKIKCNTTCIDAGKNGISFEYLSGFFHRNDTYINRKKELFTNLFNIGEITKNEYDKEMEMIMKIDGTANQSLCTGYNYKKDGSLKPYKFIDKCPKKKIKDLAKYMEVPYINLSLESILIYYKIDTIEDLYNKIIKYIDQEKPSDHILRLVNIWLIKNMDSITRLNSQMVNLFWNIKQYCWTDIKINKDNFEKNIKKLYIKWNKKSKEVFYLNILNDIYTDLKKKYK